MILLLFTSTGCGGDGKAMRSDWELAENTDNLDSHFNFISTWSRSRLELVDSGAIGDVVAIRSTFCTGRGERGPEAMRPEQSWIFNKAKGGGSIFNVGCYCIHHARFIFDAEPTQVFAVKQRGFEVDDASAVLLDFPDDRTAQISVGHHIANSQYAEICGTEGMPRLDVIVQMVYGSIQWVGLRCGVRK